MKLVVSLKSLIPQKLKNAYHFAVALFSVCYFRYPAGNLKVVGVTGTDGKTTTATLIYDFLKKSGKKVALVSTVSAYIGDEKINTGFHVTAPDPWLFQKLLKKIVDKGYKYAVLEATSHGLDQHRLLGSNIKVAVLTNITHEHLDYHKTYENYVVAKSKIFKGAEFALINKTDRSYQIIQKYIPAKAKVGAYDLETPPSVVREAIKSRFQEVYNQLNATAAYFAASYLGVDDRHIVQALRLFKGVDGRMEEIKNNKGIRIFIDFAHTPNAMENALNALKSQTPKNNSLINVFGCASERDIDKRPMMGEISTRLANISVFTSEDPRNEDPNKIIDQIVAGVDMTKVTEIDTRRFDVSTHRNTKHLVVRIVDRKKAIDFAINKLAKKGDLVVICGKGHERSMNIGGVELPWSDKKAVEYALKVKH